MNWKPTSDTTKLSNTLNESNDSLIFDMFSDALQESNSPISMWDWLTLSCSSNFNTTLFYSFSEQQGCGTSDQGAGLGYRQYGNDDWIFTHGSGTNYGVSNSSGHGIPYYTRHISKLFQQIFLPLVRRSYPNLIACISLMFL